MIRNILKQVTSNLKSGKQVSKLNETALRSFSTAGNQPNQPGESSQQPEETKPNQGKNQKQFDNKRNFQNNQSEDGDKKQEQSKKNFTPFKQQKKREDGEDQQNQGGFRSNQQNQGGFTSGSAQRNNKKEVIQFNLKKQEDSGRDNKNFSNQQQQQNNQGENRQKNTRFVKENEGEQNDASNSQQSQKSSIHGNGNEGQFLNQLYKSEQNRNEKQKGANQHQQLMKRIKQYESNGNPNEQDMRSAIECYTSCGMYEKTIATFKAIKESHRDLVLNETVLNAVFESYIKSSNFKFSEINDFFYAEFVQPKQLKLIYKDNVQNYISRVSVDHTISLTQRIESLTNFVNFFLEAQDSETLTSMCFNNIDLSSLSNFFGEATTQQYIDASKVLATLMSFSAGHSKGAFNQLGKNVIDHNRVQYEIINTKSIFSNLLSLKQYDICQKIVEALSKGNLLYFSSTANKSADQQKFIDYKDLIKYCIDSKRSTHFLVDVVAKKIDFEAFTSQFSKAILELKMNSNPPQVFSSEDLYEFFYNISNYGALSPSQVFVLMEISIYLKEYNLAIELFTNHQKYTNRRRDVFVYEKMLQVVNSINLRSSLPGKDHALQAYRKLYTEAEQQGGKPINFMVSKIHEIKSHIIDQNHESAYNVFNDRFLKESIANYQALKIKYFLLFLIQKQDEKGELQHSENSVNRFINSLAPKQLVQLWSEERNDSYLIKQLANKEEYNEFVKRVEVEKYFQIIKRDINNGMYTIEDRRNNLENVYINQYERYVIDNFEALDPEYTLDSKLKGAVLDGILKIRKYEEMYSKKEERKRQKQEEKGEKDEAAAQQSGVLLKHQKEMEDSQIEINKILGRPIDTPVDIPELYKKYDLEDKQNNRYIEKYVKTLKFQEQNLDKTYKMKFMNIDQYKEAAQAYPELVEQAAVLAKPQIPAEIDYIFDLMAWGAENSQPLAIQLGEIFCDLNGIVIPATLAEKINKSIDPYNDSAEFLNQLASGKRLIGDINRERIYQTYTHFAQKPQFIQTVNKLAEEDKYRDEAEYVLQKELAVSRLTKYGIPKKYIMEQLTKQ